MASIDDSATAAATAAPSSAEAGQAGGGGGGESRAVARGALVVLEGLDRSGKTTQVKLLQQRFGEQGRKVEVMRFPGRCWFSPSLSPPLEKKRKEKKKQIKNKDGKT